MNKYYTGVGSREVPSNYNKIIKVISTFLRDENYVLRSGGADGSDSIFEQYAGNLKEIYLPWKGFNNNTSNLLFDDKAILIAKDIHPAYDKLSQGAKKLHARNIHQVLGQNLNTPSKFLIAYTKNGEMVGGTRTALVLAERNKIPIFNIGFFDLGFTDTNEVINSFVDFYKTYKD